MENKNTISVSASLINGGYIDVLENATPKEAIEEYFYPDCKPPVSTLTIKAVNESGKTVKISISQSCITISDFL
jgi:hypothetical protein